MEKAAHKIEREIIMDLENKIKPDFYKTKEKEIMFRWHNDNLGYPSVRISIPSDKEKLKVLFEDEEALRKIGFSFDTGYGSGIRDWEFDWSLKGKHFVQDEKTKEYVPINRNKSKKHKKGGK